MRRRGLAAALLLVPLALTGCQSAGDAAGAVVGITSGIGSANPVLGTAAALGTKAAVDALVLYIARSEQNAEQDEIAATAGALPPGGTAPWHIHHLIPFSDEHGTLLVADDIASPLAVCKEVIFTVVAGHQTAHYVTTACRDNGEWRWASAEPATNRWGSLQ
jgi:hypothetical protein